MISVPISPDEFYTAIQQLELRLAVQLIYVRESDSVIVAPLHHLATVEAEASSSRKSDSERAKHLKELARQWTSIIALSAIEHPYWREIFAGIPKALKRELPRKPPAWIKFFHQTLVTGDDDTVHVPAYPTLVAKAKDGGVWGASPEPAGDLYKVLQALGYPPPQAVRRGPKPKKKPGPEPN